ncbi:hypothetical protein TRIUR3_28037 [Triticum urartu]|uniref:Uncharacterized protein n=1 Tax=Triticum urartu TaxID=4572 RepID=M7ZY46_TRIUA|nr:hypothetical protein TRIUR3_28037 [Triticum urartu]
MVARARVDDEATVSRLKTNDDGAGNSGGQRAWRYAEDGRRGMAVEVAKKGRRQGCGDADGLAGHAGDGRSCDEEAGVQKMAMRRSKRRGSAGGPARRPSEARCGGGDGQRRVG